MGKKITEYYQKAQEMGSLKAKMRLAMLTLISSGEADSVPDSPENIQKFEAALQELKKEFKV